MKPRIGMVEAQGGSVIVLEYTHQHLLAFTHLEHIWIVY